MFQHLKKCSLALLVLLTGCVANILDPAKEAQKLLPKEGETYTTSVRVGIYDVPLPKGIWTVSHSKAEATSKVPTGKVILVKEFNKTLSSSVLIELPLGLDIVEYSAVSESVIQQSQFSAMNTSDISNAFYTKSFYVAAPNTKVKPRGYSSRSLMYIAPTKMEASYYGESYLEKTGLSFPVHHNFFRVGFQIVGSSNKLFVSYFIDPRTKCVSNITGNIDDTPWKPSRHYLLSEKNKKFLSQLNSWGQMMLHRVLKAYNNRY